jgi:hypothetical protein
LGVGLVGLGDGLPDGLHVEADSIVADTDDHVLSQLFGSEGDGALARLARCLAFFRRLDAVPDGVAQQVDQRVFDSLQDLFVQLGFAADDLQPGLLARFMGHVAHHAPKRAGDGVEGQHADAFDLVLHPVDYQRHVHHVVGILVCQGADQHVHFAQPLLTGLEILQQPFDIFSLPVLAAALAGHSAVDAADGQPLSLPACREILELVYLGQVLLGADLGDEQFRQLGHERVELAHADADRVVGGGDGDGRGSGCGFLRDWRRGGWLIFLACLRHALLRGAERLQGRQRLQRLHRRRGLTCLVSRLHRLDRVEGLVAGGEKVRRQFDGIALDAVQYPLEGVRQLLDHGDSHGARGPFQAVGGAESVLQHGLALFPADAALLQGQQSVGHGLDVLVQFGAK